jgi:sucrose-6-phosphate hydrolase SacC (GH32 family)
MKKLAAPARWPGGADLNFELPCITRRFFLIASVGLFASKFDFAESRALPVLWWKLDDEGDLAAEAVRGTRDVITGRTGHPNWVGEGSDRALRLDGYSVWINHVSGQLPLPTTGEFAITAWLALESYPVNEAAIVQQGSKSEGEVRFSIDKWGHLRFLQGDESSVKTCQSEVPLPRGKWIHLAVSVSQSGETILYLNGAPCGRSTASQAPRSFVVNARGITLARSNDSPATAEIFMTGVLNGLIKDVRVFNTSLSKESINSVLERSMPNGLPDLQINGIWFPDDRQRPEYHALPPRAWTNEPHGLIHWKGEYHLFYQKNANGPYWGHINWGHMTSPDMYRWTERPVAISPGPGPDSEGCWSGSVIEHDGKLALIYTGGGGRKASICLALSEDGIHFTKHPDNPVIPQPPPDRNPEFRDPFVWREGDVYYMIVGSAVKDVGGTSLLYRSEDLVSWRFLKSLMVGNKDNSGVFWEMPIFVKLGDRHVLIVCEVPGRASYWVGTWKDETFTPDAIAPRRLDLFNHYLSPTPHITQDGQVITIGIIPEMRSSKDQWQAGWAHLYGIPRMLSLDAGGRLQQVPAPGISSASRVIFSGREMQLPEGTPNLLNSTAGSCLEVSVTFARGQSKSVSILLRRSPDGREQTVLRYEWTTGTLILDRSASSLNTAVSHAVQSTHYDPLKPDRLDFQVFLDNSVLEVFVDRRDAFASRIYPALNDSVGVALSCEGGIAIVENIRVSEIPVIAFSNPLLKSGLPQLSSPMRS